jgi:hypothetical protein
MGAKNINPKFNASDLQGHVEALINTPSILDENLNIVLSTKQNLKERKSKRIDFQRAFMSHNGNPVFYPHSIILIQGQTGVHKSRLAETICSALLKTNDCKTQHLGFSKELMEKDFHVTYVDTERNLTEQLPYALQQIQIKAGYKMEDHPENFDYLSLLEVPRNKRFGTLEAYLKMKEHEVTNPQFIVLDVSTDCLEDFNKADQSMQLIDLMNRMVNRFNVAFLCLIHENPKSDKARGHFGTELMNKSSTAIQIAFEKDAAGNDTDLIRIKYMKTRNSKRFEPFYAKYCSDAKGLVLAESFEVAEVFSKRKHKAGTHDVAEVLEAYLGDMVEVKKGEILDHLISQFKCSPRTAEDRLKELIENESIMLNYSGDQCTLKKYKPEKSKEIHYFLKRLDNDI